MWFTKWPAQCGAFLKPDVLVGLVAVLPLFFSTRATAQTVSLSATSINFGNTAVGSVSPAKTVLLTNTGTATLTISSIAASGPFTQTNTCGSSVSAGKKCSILITFAPTATGAASGAVTITDNASDSPQTISLSGTGIAAVTLSPTALNFASRTVGTTSNPVSVTLTNNQTSALSISNVSVSGDFSQTNTCGTTLAAKAKCTISVSFTPTVVGSRTGTLTVTDGASNSPQTATLSGTGSTSGLVSIAITPANPSIVVGATQQFVATGTFSSGNTYNLTQSVTWTSSKQSVATISNTAGTQGLATALAVGKVTIKAASGNVTSLTALTVASSSLVSIAVTPAAPTISVGAKQQFTATGTYSDGSTQNLTASCTWSSSASGVATINSVGLATSVAAGTTIITATSGSISGSATLTVNSVVLVSIAVTPANPSFALGTTQAMKATGTYSDGSTLDLTTTAAWSTGDSTIATVSNKGIVTSVAVGSTSVTAASGTITGSTTLNVTPATLVSIAVTPAVPSIVLGTTLQFTATGTYTDGSTQDITATVQWMSGNPQVATINSGTAGLATSVAPGTVSIIALSGSITGSTTLTVTAATLVSIAVNPPAPSIAQSVQQQFTATGTYTDSTTQDLTTTVQWSSDTPAVATISNDAGTVGLAVSVSQGTATITATVGSISGTTTLTVTSMALGSITVNPDSASVALGTTQQFTASGTFSDGTMQDITQSGHWSSSDATVATISNSTATAGLATTTGAGTATINIASGTITGSASFTVTPATLVSIAIAPENPTISLGATQQFTATGTYTDGSSQDVTSVGTWGSSDATVAVVGNSAGSYGLATSAGLGTVTISVVSGTVSASTTLVVSATSVTVNPAALTFGTQAVGTTSPTQTVTLANTSTSALNITSIVAVGDFAQSNTCGSIVDGGDSCTITVSFTPLTAGTRNGSVTITDNGSGSPQVVTLTGTGQTSTFHHIIVVVQENRTPDNLFQGLCSPPFGSASSCSSTPTGSQYDIQTSNWIDKTSSTGVTQPAPIGLVNSYDLDHSHTAFTAMCDMNEQGVCQMDGVASVLCNGTCGTQPQFKFVDNSTSVVSPYLTLATQYGWANYMFQTNQGPSFPAHLYLFGGTSAPSADDDAIGTFAAENMTPGTAAAGCIAPSGTVVRLVTPQNESQSIYPCFEHETLADLFDSLGVSWKYYTVGANSIWTAPNAIQHICVPSAPTGGSCTGPDWTSDVVLKPTQVLTDIANCKLPQVSWVIPTGVNSDHAKSNTGGGPSWVASIVNAVGNNSQCSSGELYWNDTAILITWDDWGGWYDHEPPTILAGAQGDYQYGFRVPFVFVSAYTAPAYVDNSRMDFGTILRFIEQNFGIAEGALNFADARSSTDLSGFFNLQLVPRPFQTVAAPLDANHFVNDNTPPTDPDDY